MKHALLVGILSLTACGAGSAQNPSAQNTAAASGSGEECHEETQLGSTIPRRVCRNKATSDAERTNAQEMMSTPRNNTSGGPGN